VFAGTSGKRALPFHLDPVGLKYTVGTTGSRTTVGIPGTGVSYTQVHSSKPGSTPPPSPLAPASASTQNPAKRRPSRVFYALGFIMLVIWALGKLSEQKVPTSSIANSLSSPTPSISASFAPSVARALPRALPVETPVSNQSPALTQTESSPDYFAATSQPSATAIPAAAAPTYRVVHIVSRDFLNLRQGPGSSYPLLARIPPNARGITLRSGRAANGLTIWQEISVGNYTGWVNEIYLKADAAPR
jgi:Bacterial SH3 domain